jgi:hypothetical protein
MQPHSLFPINLGSKSADDIATTILNKKLTFERFISISNQDKSAARFWWQVAAWVPNMFCNFYFAKSHKIDNNSVTTEAREIIGTDLEFL